MGRVVPFLLVLVACGDPYRVEPLALEGRENAARVAGGFKDAKRIAVAREVAERFVELVESGKCGEAWGSLSAGYRRRFAAVAGGEGEAVKLCCDGYREEGDVLVQGDWRVVLLGRLPYYVTTVPPELELRSQAGREVFYAVQRDGGYAGFVLVDESGVLRLEPL